ncbi:MAG: YaaL family protein [Lachnospiraceae bacterium]|nr:YaaL family protein [Lachnospiraceae bacterium]
MKFYFSQLGNNLFAARQTIKEKEITAADIYRNTLLEDLRKTKEALEVAYMGFDNVTEPELIDCYIYELNSVTTRYNYLLEQIGQLNNKEKSERAHEPMPLAIPVLSSEPGEMPLFSDVTGLNPLCTESTVSTVG